MSYANSLGLGVLVETHSEPEIETAVSLGAKLIGINTRDLNTFQTDPKLFAKLAGQLPTGVIKVAESAVKTLDDVRLYRDSGADVVLIGEALVTGDWEKLIPQIVAVS
jgi:indole-3-glycerol phosphate synthase